MAIVGAHMLLYTPEADALREVLKDALGLPFVEDIPGGVEVMLYQPAHASPLDVDTCLGKSYVLEWAHVRAHLIVAGLFVAGVLASSGSARVASSGRLTVFAAASLTDVFPKIDSRPRYGFAGTDVLAVQIQQGAPADVFAAASPKYPELLYKQGLVQKPIPFATNTLVLVIPKSNPAQIHTVDDLRKPGVKIVIGDPAVPVGSYTRTVLGNLGISAAVLKNVVSQETDVRSVLGKVALGEADAGFVYLTDARTVRGKVKVIALRESAQPHVVYEAAVVKGSPHLQAAYRYVTRLIRPAAQRELERYGFGPRPTG